MEMTETYKKLVQFFGSQSETARKLGIKQPSVNAWLTGKAYMGAVTANLAEHETNGEFKAVDLCPRLAEIEQIKTPSGN